MSGLCNIEPMGRRRRAGLGVATALVVGATLLVLDDDLSSRWWRLALVPLIAFAALCVFQALEGT